MRKKLRQLIPDAEAIRNNRWFAPFSSTLLHPRLWHLNRHSAAGGIAVGLFCGLIPGPFQMAAAAILAVVLRVNLPLALFATLYTNPLTIVPLYLLAFTIGNVAVGNGSAAFAPPPDWSGDLGTWVEALLDWMQGLGKPLFVGLVLLASLLAVIGYVAVRAAYRLWLVRAWRRRRVRPR